jgi:uncharacterized membrane protein YhaH (DUF805 family)
MSMSFRARFLSLRGRIPRAAFNLSLLVWFCVAMVLFVFLDASFGAQSTLLMYPPAAWCLLALLAKRLHDHGRSLWALLWVLIPLFGPLYLAVLLCCWRGSQGENQYGEDVLMRGADYLQVAAP